MIKRNTFKQPVPIVTWAVQLPQGATKGRPLAAYKADGSSIEIDSWTFNEQGVLQVNFGIDPVSGDLEYEYQMQEPVVDPTNKPLVNIENNYGGVSVGTGNFPIQ